MKKIFVFISMTALMACGNASQKQADTQQTKPIGKPEVIITDGKMTPEVLWSFGRVGNICISPDNKQIAFTVTYYSISENKGNAEIYVMDADGGNKRQLTSTVKSEGSLKWLQSGKIAFLREGKLWNIDPSTGAETQVSAIEEAIDGFLYSPAEDQIALVISTKIDKYAGKEVYNDLDKANALIYDDLMYRHWNEWKDGMYNHIYVGAVEGGKVSAVKDIMPGEPYDAPTKPFGGTEEIAWHPDGKTLVYTCKKLKGKDYAFSTNTDLYAYSLADGSVRNLTPDMPGYDKYPQFSPDGSQAIFTSMRRAGFEADKERIMLLDWATGAIKDVSEALDASPSSMCWSPDGKTLYLTAPYQEAHQIYGLDLASGVFTQITNDATVDYQNVTLAGGKLFATRTSHVTPAEIFSIDLSGGGAAKELSFVNRDLLAKIKSPKVEKRFVTTTDKKQMVTWVIYPPDFDPSKKYPLLLICTGGPQGVFGPSFSYRWNYMLMASQGYVVVAPARRGTSGSGQEWCDAISKNHGEQEERDLLAAIDAVSREPWADEQRMGACGASYGGYSIFHLAGTHKKRFKAFLAHCGIFNMEM
ncbi:MAG: prolyl oligopeptidase family serine peptidase, partial [Tannerella sp.]|nr:prolyl oligopeptidase family serine peptidase [Tannerella sp.]